MNYRHAYHAGNFADVLKHAVLVWTVRYLQQKEGPICLIDTHGGAGLYDLGGEAARKTGEATGGILRLAQEPGLFPEVFALYWDLVRQANAGGGLARYPGSPWLMAAMLRAQDRAVVGELHPEEAAALRATVPPKRVRIIEGDGYAILNKNVPPAVKRGLVLIDPPYEASDEFERLARAVIGAHTKWPTGVYLIWYPLKDSAAVARFRAELSNAGIEKVTTVMLDVGDFEPGLRACGLLCINAPWTLADEWREPLNWLARVLAKSPQARAELS